jgi:hypothetical protein
MQEGVSLAPAPGMTTPEVITAHLRADRALTPETADALATMVRLAYEAVSRGEFKSNKKTERDDATRVQDVG